MKAIEALKRCQRLFKEALPKFNWGASFLDSNAIQLLNEVPGEVENAIKEAEDAYKSGFLAAVELVRDKEDRCGIGSMCSQWTSEDVAEDILERAGFKEKS